MLYSEPKGWQREYPHGKPDGEGCVATQMLDGGLHSRQRSPREVCRVV
jgi:hypothetical protein